MNIQQGLLSALLIAGLASTFAGPAYAEEEFAQRTVSFADLNLDSPAGVETLYGRLRRAARSVCGSSGSALAADIGQRQTCVSTAVENAVSDINNGQLTAFHRQKTGAGVQKVAARQ